MSSSSRDGLLAVSGTFVALSTIAVVLRFCVRHKQKQPLKMDDWLALPALTSYIAAAACTFVSVHRMFLGVPDAEYTPELEAAIAKSKLNAVLTLCLDILVNTTLACSKLSIVFFYRRIFVTGALRRKDWMDIATQATIAIIILWLLVFQFLTGFSCGTHLSALWDGTYARYCGIAFPNLYGLAISDFLLDVWVLVLPIPKILQIQAPLSKKMSVLGVFLLAFIGLGACIARMVQYIHVETGGPAYLFSHSEMRITTQQFYLNMLEAGMSCLAINLPSLWTLVASFSVERAVHSARSLRSLPSLVLRQTSSSSGGTTRNDSVTVLDKERSNSKSGPDHQLSGAAFETSSQMEAQKSMIWASPEAETNSATKREKSIHVTQEFEVRRH